MTRFNRLAELGSETVARQAGLQRVRRLGVAAAITVGFAGCSNSANPVVSDAVPNTVATTLRPAPVTTTAPVSTTAPIPPAPVVVKVTTRIGDQTVSDEVVLSAETTSDPFGRFATCSGAWNTFGAYNMLVSNPDPKVGSVQISTVDSVRRPRTARATARIERGSEVHLSTGILEFADGFTKGVFGGQTTDGKEIAIDFACESDRQPQPIDRTRQFVDVAVLLRSEGRERIVSAGVAQGCDEGRIELAADPAEPFALGAISATTIAPDALAIRIGDRELEFETQTVTPLDATSGTFRAVTTDGIVVTGAYYCRG